MVWGCISYDDKMELVTIQGRLRGERYIREVLEPVVVPHFDNHSLASRPLFLDDNARLHRSRAVTAFIQRNGNIALAGQKVPILTHWSITGISLRVEYKEWTLPLKILMNWKQLCIMSGNS